MRWPPGSYTASKVGRFSGIDQTLFKRDLVLSVPNTTQ